jgi:uncharacterized cupredoxin-like copper-binding protein
MARIRRCNAIGVAIAITLSTPVFGHGDGGHARPKKAVQAEQMPFGIAGDPTRVSRTVEMDMLDTFRYLPDKLEVKRGETIRFEVHNKGNIMHEIVIGTMAQLKEHAALMNKSPEMEHEAPYMLHIAPGKSGKIVWRFNRPGTFNFACLIAGHFEAGMVGTVVVR